jgi:uncharacterized protein (TIGR00730 family)
MGQKYDKTYCRLPKSTDICSNDKQGSMVKRVGVFCSASDAVDAIYFESAYRFGEWLGKTGRTMIYGGTALGLMEQTARAVKENGGYVIGVLPSILKKNGLGSSFCNQMLYSNDLSDRKDTILKGADVLIALPGGIGTLDEVFHVMAAATVGYHNKKIIFYNINGFYNKLFSLLDDLNANHFITTGSLSDYYDVANTFEELTLFLI